MSRGKNPVFNSGADIFSSTGAGDQEQPSIMLARALFGSVGSILFLYTAHEVYRNLQYRNDDPPSVAKFALLGGFIGATAGVAFSGNRDDIPQNTWIGGGVGLTFGILVGLILRNRHAAAVRAAARAAPAGGAAPAKAEPGPDPVVVSVKDGNMQIVHGAAAIYSGSAGQSSASGQVAVNNNENSRQEGAPPSPPKAPADLGSASAKDPSNSQAELRPGGTPVSPPPSAEIVVEIKGSGLEMAPVLQSRIIASPSQPLEAVSSPLPSVVQAQENPHPEGAASPKAGAVASKDNKELRQEGAHASAPAAAASVSFVNRNSPRAASATLSKLRHRGAASPKSPA